MERAGTAALSWKRSITGVEMFVRDVEGIRGYAKDASILMHQAITSVGNLKQSVLWKRSVRISVIILNRLRVLALLEIDLKRH